MNGNYYQVPQALLNQVYNYLRLQPFAEVKELVPKLENEVKLVQVTPEEAPVSETVIEATPEQLTEVSDAKQEEAPQA